MTLERKNRCVGLRMPLGKRRQVEVWYCPAGERIAPHKHERIHSFILALWGRQRWTVCEQVRMVLGPVRKRLSTKRWTLAAQAIPAGVRHAATAVTRSLFLNFERSADGSKLVSAADDFVEVP